MDTITAQAQPAVEKLLQDPTDKLYAELAIRAKALSTNLQSAASFQPDVQYDAPLMGPMDELKKWGEAFFARINADAYDLVCGSSTGFLSQSERDTLNAAFNAGQTAVAAALAGLFVTYFGLAAGVAAVVAALVVRLFFRGAYQATCNVWKGHLSGGVSTATNPGTSPG